MSLTFGLPTFPGGIHLPDHKSPTAGLPIEVFPLPVRLAVSLAQAPGAASRPVVAAGQRVLRGQLIAEAGGLAGAALHAPTSGTVERIGECPHPAGLRVPAVFIAADGADQWAAGADAALSEEAAAALTPREIVERVRAAGVVGMGGAAFPTHLKLSPPAEKPVETVILNGCESEPYLSADHRLMLERPLDVAHGLCLMMRAVGARRGLIAVEANKPDAHERLLREVRGLEGLSCRMVAVKYPQGGERPLIRALLGREVPSGALPADAGVLVQNVATAAAVAEAVLLARPVTERVLTVGGDGVARPANLLCRIGTPARALLESRGLLPGARRLVFGGPMMGLAQWTADVPVLKGTGGVLVLTAPPGPEPAACINCGRCAQSCPARLAPGELARLAERGQFAEMVRRHLLDCMECGACAWRCPARRPLTQWNRQAKLEAQLARLAAEAAGKAPSR